MAHSGVAAAELSIVFVPGRVIRRLNKSSLGHDYVTDVITFDLSDGSNAGHVDGEIYLCPDEARRNGRAYGEPVARELLRYVAHGILHLLGQDDATPRQRASMQAREDALLALIA